LALPLIASANHEIILYRVKPDRPHPDVPFHFLRGRRPLGSDAGDGVGMKRDYSVIAGWQFNF
jgi:hypothetical protein